MLNFGPFRNMLSDSLRLEIQGENISSYEKLVSSFLHKVGIYHCLGQAFSCSKNIYGGKCRLGLEISFLGKPSEAYFLLRLSCQLVSQSVYFSLVEIPNYPVVVFFSQFILRRDFRSWGVRMRGFQFRGNSYLFVHRNS